MRRLVFLIVLTLSGSVISAQKDPVAVFEVNAGDFDRFDTPVTADLGSLGLPIENCDFILFEILNGEKKLTSCQPDPGSRPLLVWILSGETKAGSVRIFELYCDSIKNTDPAIKAIKNSRTIDLSIDNKHVLSYVHATHFPPEGVSDIYKKSAFIHPLSSPSGNVLSRINPPDHYHHYGLWGPWTKTHYKGQEIDFWNLNMGQGTVRFSGINSLVKGDVFGSFTVKQDHVAFLLPGEDLTILNEMLELRLWNVVLPGNKDIYLLDYISLMSCATSESLVLDAYRYGGGIGLRATEEWTKDNSWTLTSEGKTRKDADASHGRWVDIGGEFAGKGTSGILFMSAPSNREHPESMRVWPENITGRGDVFFEFCPIRHLSWTLEPGKVYSQRYRLLIYDGKIDKDTADRLWNDFAYPPVVTIKKK